MTELDAPEIDLLNLDRFADGVPHDWFTWLRANDPVHHHAEPDGPGFWVITKLEDVITCSRDFATFSSAAALGGVVGLPEPGPDEEDHSEVTGSLLLYMDPPGHTRYRRLVNRGFTPRMIAKMEGHIRDLTAENLDETLPRGEVDFVVDVAAELPLKVIAELIGVPREDRHKIFDWSNRLVAGGDDEEYKVSEDRLAEAQVEMFLYAQKLAEAHRTNPGDDIIDALLNAEIDGESLSETDFNMFFVLLSVAGNETTRNGMPGGLVGLLGDPAAQRALRADPTLIPNAVEEMLRWWTPVMTFRRTATRGVELAGRTLHRGDKVVVSFAAANRDPAVFTDPDRFDIGRDNARRHLAFGAGPHVCLGAFLARSMMTRMVTELLGRTQWIESAGGPVWLQSNFQRGVKRLPIAWRA